MIIELTTKLLDGLTLAKANVLIAADGGKPQADRADLGDSVVRGLTIRVTKKGKKAWTFTYTSPVTGNQAREGLGVYGKEEDGGVSLMLARMKATAFKTQTHNDVDPKIARLAAVPDKTIAQVVEERLAMEVRGKLKTASDVEGIYTQHLGKLGAMSIKAFKVNPHYNDIITPYLLADKKRMATVIRSALMCLFEYAFQKDYVDVNPLLKTPECHKYKARERALDETEIKALWKKLPTALAKTPRTQCVIKLLLATGQRPGEVSGIREAEIVEKSPTEWLWVIPGDIRDSNERLVKAGRTKNGKEHVVFLSALAIKLIKEARELKGGKDASPYLFPNRNGKPTSVEQIGNSLWVARSAPSVNTFLKFGCDDWTAHTLRHTVVTMMKSIGIASDVLSRVVNHAKMEDERGKGQSANAVARKGSDTTELYNHYGYDKEKRAALEAWGAHLAEMVGENIDPPKLRLVA